ncbi:glutamate-cysteine ligase modifier subunit [Arctopsyche grandis]|uniref:glutamate-cysteine ligase modifier subunit n=1 Tax=Arctopsyche grandis TaxID=121162 RepID=UPI00406D8E46
MFSQKKIVINTGNVLNIIDINKKVGQNVTEELTESLQITLDEWKKSVKTVDEKAESLKISRLNDDSQTKLAEEDRKNLKIGVKIFVQDHSAESLEECLENVFKTLGINTIDNVIVAYSPLSIAIPNGKEEGSDSSDADSSKCDRILPGLLQLWRVLESYVKKERILQVGVSDIEESCFKRLYAECEIRPSIVQINLASCCVVPPGLQAFCKDHDVQLLTHSDPQEIISKEALDTVVSNGVKAIQWCLRYQVHIKCRGVLALKGYMLSATLQ